MIGAGKQMAGLSTGSEMDAIFNAQTYSGTSAARSITTGFDLASGGMVMIYPRNQPGWSGAAYDTIRGTNTLATANSNQQAATSTALTGYTSTGFTLGTDSGNWANTSGTNYVAWTFKETSQFFDVVSYTGTGTNRNLSHNLGAIPDLLIVKRLNGATANWACRARVAGNTTYFFLNGSAVPSTTNGTQYWNSAAMTSTTIPLGTNAAVNAVGSNYIAYLFGGDSSKFAHGSVTGTGSLTVTTGWRPQWVMYKATNVTFNVSVMDKSRPFATTFSSSDPTSWAYPGVTVGESTSWGDYTTPTGFSIFASASRTYYWWAIKE